MILETHIKLWVTVPDPKKIFLPKKLGKLTKNGPKTGFF